MAEDPERLRKRIGLVVGIGLFLAIALIPSELHRIEGFGKRPAHAAACAVLMVVFWFTETLPMHWTALAPIVLYPLLGVFGGGWIRDTARSVEPFVDAYMFLFLGGMMIGAASERSGLHRRVALRIMRGIGAEPARLLLGVLVSTAFVSLWISNTATAVMMLPIGTALLAQLEATSGRKLWGYGTAIMLGVAYASNVGGIGTKIGTGPNSIFTGWVQRQMGLELSFPLYIALAFPFVVLFLPVVWGALWHVGRVDAPRSSGGKEVLDRALAELGPMSRQQKRVLAVFLAAAGLWMAGGLLREPLAALLGELWPGIRFEGKHYEAAVAMVAGAVLLLLRELEPAALLRLPWGPLLLIGGGFALAAGIEGSGLSLWLGAQLGGITTLPIFGQIALAAGATVLLSAVASNVATITVLLNLLPRSVPVLLVSTMACSCDFMLPAGTPPNAIVFGSGRIRLPVMMRTGFVLDVAAALILTAYGQFYLRLFFS